MNEYQTTVTLTAEGTFVVPGPKGLPAGTRAEVTVRVEEASSGSSPLATLLDRIAARPVGPEDVRRADEGQALLRTMREEWD